MPSTYAANEGSESVRNGGDDDETVIAIAVGASVGALILIGVITAVIILGLIIYRRRAFNKYAAEYRKRVLPYAKGGSQSCIRIICLTFHDVTMQLTKEVVT